MSASVLRVGIENSMSLCISRFGVWHTSRSQSRSGKYDSRVRSKGYSKSVSAYKDRGKYKISSSRNGVRGGSRYKSWSECRTR